MKRDTSTRASALLRKASGGYEPTRADREKTRAAIARRLAVGVAAAAAVSAGVKSAAAAPSIAPAAGVAAGAGTVGAGVAAVGTSAGVGVTAASVASVGLATKIAAAIAIFGTVSAGAVGVQRLTSSPAPKNAPIVTVASPAVMTTVAGSPLPLPRPSVAQEPVLSEPAPVAVEPAGEATPTVERAPTLANLPEKQAVRATATMATASVKAVDAPVVAQEPSLQTGAEVALLEQAQHALEAKHGERALALLDEHARTYPNGALAEERDAARVLALCETGRDDEAHAEADAFVVAHPRSPLAARVRAACPASSYPSSD